MKNLVARFLSRVSILWDRYKRPVKRLYQIPLIGAAYLYRRILKRPLFVGVTGSLGKTQSKALIAAVLAERGPVRFDPSTDNRTYDAAKNLLKTHPSHRGCVQEIGMAGPGTMARPVRLFQPDIAVITNIRSDHSADFPTRRAHVLEKARIISDLPQTGWAILNADEPDLDIFVQQTNAKILTYGFSAGADVRAVDFQYHPPDPVCLQVRIAGETQAVSTQLHGAHNAYAILAALAVGHAAGIAANLAAGAIALVQPAEGRMQYTEHPDGVRFLLDDFKASVGSLIGVIDYLRAYSSTWGKKYLVVGSIIYGAGNLVDDYQRVLEEAFDHSDEVLLVGSMVTGLDTALLSKAAHIFETTKQCADYLLPRLRPGDLVVLKCRNWEDHLRRIEISRRATVNCWQMFCARKTFCEDCRFVEASID